MRDQNKEVPSKHTMDAALRVAIYVRVSTQEQAEEGYSIDAQLERLRAYCTARGWTIADEYVDPGYSGAKLERPAIQKLIYDVRSRKNDIDVVLVFKLDRLSRSQKDTLYLIEDVFITNQVDFISINESFDTSTPYGMVMIGILSAFAQFERENIKLRTQMGLTERVKDGYWRGGGKPPIGYRYDRERGTLAIDPYEAAQIRELFDLFVNRHYSTKKIGRLMAQKYPEHAGTYTGSADIAKILRRKTYIGQVPWKGESYDGRHEPIIDAALFAQAQALLAQRDSGQKNARANFLLTGMLWCAQCGARYYSVGAYRGSKKLSCAQRRMIHSYTCYSRARTNPRMVRDPHCTNKSWPTDELEDYVLKEVQCLKFEQAHFTAVAAQNAPVQPPQIELLAQHDAEITRQISRLLDLYQRQNIPYEQIADRLQTLTGEQASVQAQMQAQMPDDSILIHPKTALDFLDKIGLVLSAGTMEEKRRILRALIQRIDINAETMKITWNFA